MDLHNEENRDMYCSRSCIRLIKSREMRGAGRVGCMVEGRDCRGIGVET